MNLFRRIFNARSKTGQKGARMGTENTATPPAIDQAALNKAIAEGIAAALPGAVEAATKPLVQEIAQLKAATVPAKEKEAAKPADAPKGLSAEDVVKLLDERDAKRASSAQRDKFIGEKLKDLPEVFRNQLGNDPAKWSAEEQAIRESYKKVLADAGVKAPNLGNANGEGGQTPEQKAVDKSKVDPLTRIEMGIKA